jgi:tRNA-2-methylthio-N6-dimethylallyladenosine synthase
MNRKYTREDYLALVDKIKARIPDARITTDIMVGFNGERDIDFLNTLDLVKQCQFSNAFCFVFSKRKGTAAYTLVEEVAPEIKKERIKQLISLQNQITREISKEYIGNTYEILVEDVNGKTPNTYCGRTDCGRLVNFESDVDIRNLFVDVKITKAKSATLWGEIIKDNV